MLLLNHPMFFSNNSLTMLEWDNNWIIMPLMDSLKWNFISEIL